MMNSMSPAKIRFMQDSVCRRFRDGRSVNGSLESIINGQMKASDFPTITVVKKDGKYYSQDNRRLYVFRALYVKGLLNSVQVYIGSYFEYRKFTTINDGASLFVRGATTYPHAISSTDISSQSVSTLISSTSNETRSLPFHTSGSNLSPFQTISIPQKLSSIHRLSIQLAEEIIEIPPNQIRFYHHEIDVDLRGRNANDVINDKATVLNEIKSIDFGTIQVFKNEHGFWFSQRFNWMLYIARALQYKGKLRKIKAKVLKESTCNITDPIGGTCINILGAPTLPHSDLDFALRL